MVVFGGLHAVQRAVLGLTGFLLELVSTLQVMGHGVHMG